MRRKNQRGSAIIESGLVLSSFMFMLIGPIDFGQFLFRHQSIVERGRYAARWAITKSYSESTAQSAKNLVLYFQQSVTDEPPPAFWGLSPDDVTVTKVSGAANEPDRIVIRINNRFMMFSPYVAGQHQGRSIVVSMPYEGLS